MDAENKVRGLYNKCHPDSYIWMFFCIKKIMEETKIIFPENIVKSDVYSTALSTKETIDRPKLILTMNDIDL